MGYFVSGGGGVAGNRNIIWNHLSGLDGGDGSPLVHIIASSTDPEVTTPGQYTFYGRDNKGPQGFFACGTTPAWYPLKQIVFFDEQERPLKLSTLPVSDTPTPFPAGTQRVKVGGSALPTAFASGQVYLNLMTTIAGNPNPPEDVAAESAQAWVTVHQKGTGRYSVGYPALLLDSAKSANVILLPVP